MWCHKKQLKDKKTIKASSDNKILQKKIKLTGIKLSLQLI